MKLISETIKQKIKGKLWLWRPILFFSITGLIVFVIASDSIYTDNQLTTLRAEQPIMKVEMEVESDSSINNIVLTNSMQLDSINDAFKAVQEKEIQKGGLFDTSASINVYKGGKKIDLFIQHSPYHGWMIEVGSKTLINDYLFSLVRRYTKTLQKK